MVAVVMVRVVGHSLVLTLWEGASLSSSTFLWEGPSCSNVRTQKYFARYVDEIFSNWVKIILQDNRQLLKVDQHQLSLKSETAEWDNQRIANLQNLQTRQVFWDFLGANWSDSPEKVEGKQLFRRAVDDEVAKMYITDLRDEDIELSVKVVIQVTICEHQIGRLMTAMWPTSLWTLEQAN